MAALDDLRKKLRYTNTLDIWIALREEIGRDWFDVEKYHKFLSFLKQLDLSLLQPSVIDEVGRKGEFLEQAFKMTGSVLEVYVVRLDELAVTQIRSFSQD